MITPLPEKFPTTALRNFTIGEVEPENDQLLLPCFCDIPPIDRFLGANKSILLGGKGTGKTAIFTLLKRGQRAFPNTRRAKQRIIPIETDIEYSRLKYAAFDVIKSDIPDADVQYRYLWEIYVLYRIIVELNETGILSDSRLKKDAMRFLEIFDVKDRSPSLLDFITSIKRTAGFKLDTTNPAFPSPDFYVSAEPAEHAISPQEKLDVSISDLKKLVNQCLTSYKEYVYVIVDNIDDFVSREEYETQKLLLQGLVQCTRGYAPYRHIKVKLLLRTELFENIDFSQVGGYDKVVPSTERLTWTRSDIWKFIGERVLWNLKNNLGIPQFEYNEGAHQLTLEPYKKKIAWYDRLLEILGIRKTRKKDQHDSRDRSLRDDAYKAAITSIFPRTIAHFDEAGNEETMDIFEFLDSHFRLGNGELTPRILMIYVQKVFELCAEYYEKNPEPLIAKNANGEYPLLKRREISAAYGWLQDQVTNIFLGSVTHQEWRGWLEVLLRRKGKKYSFSYRQIRSAIGVADGVEIKEFMAYICHLGVVSCKDKKVALEQRNYEFPILLRKNFAHALYAGN